MSKTIFTQEELDRFGVQELEFDYVQIHNKEGVLLSHAHFTKALNKNTNSIVDRVLIKNFAGNTIFYGDNLTIDELKRYYSQDVTYGVLQIVGNNMSKYANPELNNRELYENLSEKDSSSYKTNIVATSDKGLAVYQKDGKKIFEANYVLKRENFKENLNITLPKIQMYNMVSNSALSMDTMPPKEFKKYFQKEILNSVRDAYKNEEIFIEDNKITQPNVNLIQSTRGGHVYKSVENLKDKTCDVEYFQINPQAPGKLDFVEEKNIDFLMEGSKKYRAIKSLKFMNKEAVKECSQRLNLNLKKPVAPPKGIDIIDNNDGTSSFVIAGTKCPPIKNEDIAAKLEDLASKFRAKEIKEKEQDLSDNELSF